MFSVISSGIPGCFEIHAKLAKDERGKFVKLYHERAFAELGLATDFKEEYYSQSNKCVIRGMHFQTPPYEHAKTVYCLDGEVLDVVVDLRVGSPTYGKTANFHLSAEKGNFVYIPKGLAHGFCSLSENSLLLYKVTTVYNPEHDSGILWSSIDFNWPVSNPVLSQRDKSFISISEFKSPFIYE